jgi:uncharacterized membrane protein required for colicin V production
MGYNGFGRGLLTEILQLIGAVSIVCLTANFWGALKDVRPIVFLPPAATAPAAFWLLFFLLLAVVHALVRRLCDLIKWERLHWMIQSIGLAFGAARGLWWAGFFVILLAGSGIQWLQDAVNQRSVSGPWLLPRAQQTISEIADRFPGAAFRGERLTAPLRGTGTE